MTTLHLVEDGTKSGGLIPRPAFERRLAQMTGPMALIVAAPARLRGVNRIFGHDVGDQLISAMDAMIAEFRPRSAVTGLLTGAKRCIALPCADETDAAAAAARLADLSERADTVRGAPARLRVAVVWSANGDADAAHAASMIASALAALDNVTTGAAREVVVVDPELRADDLAMARAALGSVRAGEATIALQPVVDADGSGRVLFREALIRIPSPDGGAVPAGRFMPALDRLGMTVELDIAAMERAFAALEEDPALRVSINLSGAALIGRRWPAAFERLVSAQPRAAERLIVEVTEEAALGGDNVAVGLFAMIRARGAALALDDFGAGRTSFSHLRDFRFDMVKIDGGFIKGIDRSADNRMLVSALVSIARQFEMTVIAEHVETAAEARALRGLGVDGFQGFLFGRPALVWSDGADVARGA